MLCWLPSTWSCSIQLNLLCFLSQLVKIRDVLVKKRKQTPKSTVLVISLNETFCFDTVYICSAQKCTKTSEGSQNQQVEKILKALGISYYYCIMVLKLSFINRNGIFLEWLACILKLKVQHRVNKVFSDSALSTSVVFHFWTVMTWVLLFLQRGQSSFSQRIR